MERIDVGPDTIDIGDTVEVEVYFDTEEQNDISLVGVGVLFDASKFTYLPGLSISPSYALYAGRSGIAMGPLSTNLSIRTGTDNLVLLDWSSDGLLTNTGSTLGCGPYGTFPLNPEAPSGDGCGWVMASLVFEAIDSGTTDFELSSSSPGSVMKAYNQEGVLTDYPNTVSGNFTITIPEPTSASLSIFALLSLAGLRLRAARH
jgi:hypothetical protein